MTTIDDLKRAATAQPLEGTEVWTALSLDVETEVDEALHSLSRFFEKDEHCTAVQLYVHGDKVGYLNRRDFYDAELASRLGEAQPAVLPGPPEFTFIKLACPVAGCPMLVLKIHYDERDQPKCLLHPDKILQAVT